MKKRVAKKRGLQDYREELISVQIEFNKTLSDEEIDMFIDELIEFTDKRKYGWGGRVFPDDAFLMFHTMSKYWKNRLTSKDCYVLEEFLIGNFDFIKRVGCEIELEDYLLLN
jgi:uncharacterized protein YggL (DUF469 family)